MTRIPRLLCGLGLGLGLVAGGACQPTGADTTTDDDSEGSETQGCVAGSLNCLCGEGDSCEPGLLCASMRCVDDGMMSTSGTGQVTTTDPTTMPMTMSGMETSGDTSGGTDDTGGSKCEPADGSANEACDDPAKPYCSADGACVGCTEIDCAEASPATPACGAAGLCVECTQAATDACAGTRPICDVEASACIGCSAHGQCDSGACDLATGACFTATLYVDRASPCQGDGSPAMPFCEIADAVAEVNANTPTVVRVKPSASPYTKKVDIGSNLKVAIMRDGAGTARLAVDNADSMQVNEGATAYLQNLQISQGTVHKGIFCFNGTVWLERSQIIERKGLAIDGTECQVKLHQSRLYLNLAGGIRLNGGSLSLLNSYIVTNGGAFSAVAGISLTNKASLEAVYATIANNDGAGELGDSLKCAGDGSVTLRNSVLFGRTATSSVDCPKATASTSVFDAPGLMGAGNKIIKDLDPAWFVDAETGDFAITGVAPFKDVAVWKSGDPAGDYNDTKRPATDGAADYAGADRPN